MLVICGKAGAGKDSIIKRLLEFGMDKVVCYTTRPMRDGEEDGKSYHFISDDEFRRLNSEGFFAESITYPTVHGFWSYGSCRVDYKDNSIFIGTPTSVKAANLEDYPVFLITAPDAERIDRQLDRGDNPMEVMRRLRTDEADFKDFKPRYTISNSNADDVDKVAKKIYDLYIGEMKD